MIKFLYGYVCLVVLCGLRSCAKEASSVNTFNPESEAQLIVSDSVDLSHCGILESEFVAVCDSGLVVNALDGQSLVYVLNSDGQVSESFGTEGRGPAEFLEISGLEIWHDRQNVWLGISDARRGQYVKRVLGGSARPQVVYTEDMDWDAMVRLANGMFVCAAIADSSRFYLLDSMARVLGKTDNFPPKPDGIPLISHSMACTGVLAAAPDCSMFASSVVYDGGIDVCEVRKGEIVPLWRFSQFDMDYDILPEYHNVPAPNQNSRQGYMALSFSDNYLYALYSGHKMLDEDSEMCDEVHVFDYEGRHCKRYRLDRKIYALTVDRSDNRLVGLTRDADGNVRLLVFAL